MACLLLIIVYQTWAKKSNKKYSLKDNNKEKYKDRKLSNDENLYTYDFLPSLALMKVTLLDDISAMHNENDQVDREKTAKLGIENAENVGIKKDDNVLIENRYTGRSLHISRRTIKYGIYGKGNRILTNTRIGAKIGDIVQNAVSINALKNNKNNIKGTYAMAFYAVDNEGREFIAVIMVEQYNNIVDIETYDVAHSISGRQRKSSRLAQSHRVWLTRTSVTNINISDFLEIVNETYQSVLSDDILEHFEETRNADGYYSDGVKYSVKEKTEVEKVI